MVEPSIPPMEQIILCTNWLAGISNEKIATGSSDLKATLWAIFKAKAVFPIAGRAAKIIKSPFWSPDVILSKSLKFVRIPEILPSILCNLFKRSVTSLITFFTSTNSPALRSLVMANIVFSLSSIKPSISSISPKAFSAIFVVSLMIFLKIDLLWIIFK